MDKTRCKYTLLAKRKEMNLAGSERHWKLIDIFPQLWLDMPDLWNRRLEELPGPGRTQKDPQEIVIFSVDLKYICGPDYNFSN